MTTTTKQVARGSTVQTTLDFIAHAYGADARERVLERLDPAVRERLTTAGTTTGVPYEDLFALWQRADAELATRDPRWMEAAGAFSIASRGQQLYHGLLHKTSPEEFMTQSVSLFRLYYSPGDIVVVEMGPGRAVLRLVGFDAGGALFCRRQTGGLVCATEIAGGKQVSVQHVRCEHEGDSFCEWELRWA